MPLVLIILFHIIELSYTPISQNFNHYYFYNHNRTSYYPVHIYFRFRDQQVLMVAFSLEEFREFQSDNLLENLTSDDLDILEAMLVYCSDKLKAYDESHAGIFGIGVALGDKYHCMREAWGSRWKHMYYLWPIYINNLLYYGRLDNLSFSYGYLIIVDNNFDHSINTIIGEPFPFKAETSP